MIQRRAWTITTAANATMMKANRPNTINSTGLLCRRASRKRMAALYAGLQKGAM
jgi:hypothetical protein